MFEIFTSRGGSVILCVHALRAVLCVYRYNQLKAVGIAGTAWIPLQLRAPRREEAAVREENRSVSIFRQGRQPQASERGAPVGAWIKGRNHCPA
ncbi:hypothetical protein BaRGS_00016912 [Batillaria attramentaria]|uniref:Secreted protein n=1 Tax=Batillaria attramentaria TaxID=370345 RepID=A0ABD0KXK4_9CAEN